MRMELSRIDEAHPRGRRGHGPSGATRACSPTSSACAPRPPRCGPATRARRRTSASSRRRARRCAWPSAGTAPATRSSGPPASSAPANASTRARSPSQSRCPTTRPAGLDALVDKLEEAESPPRRAQPPVSRRWPPRAFPSRRTRRSSDSRAATRRRSGVLAQKAIDSGLHLEQESINLGGARRRGCRRRPWPTASSPRTRTVEAAERLLEERQRGGYLATGGATAARRRRAHPPADRGAARHHRRCRRRRLVDPRTPPPARGRRAGVRRTRSRRPASPRTSPSTCAASTRPSTRAHASVSISPCSSTGSRSGEWHELAGTIDPVEALDIEDEVRRYAQALASLDGAAEEIDAVRLELTQVAEPFAEEALAELMRSVRAVRRRRPTRGRGDGAPPGRDRQHRPPAAAAGGGRERRAASARASSPPCSSSLGFDEGDVVDRLGALEQELAGALGREQARARATRQGRGGAGARPTSRPAPARSTGRNGARR